MKIILLAEATGGHILPALALSSSLRRENKEYLIVTVDKKIPHRLIKDEHAIFLAPISGAKEYFKGVSAVKKVAAKDDVFISFGGRLTTLYADLYLQGYHNLYSYELNAVTGRSIAITKPFVRKIFSYFPLNGKSKKVMVVGHPFEDEKHANYLRPYLKKVLVLTGSLGSKDMFQIFDRIAMMVPEVELHVSCGTSDYAFSSAITKVGFVDPAAYQNYDLVIARAGAGTIAHLLSYGLPAVLLPSPHVKDDHQLKNAKYLNAKIGLPYLEYADQDPDHIVKIIKDYSAYYKRSELVGRYLEISHSEVIKKVLDEVHKNAKIS